MKALGYRRIPRKLFIAGLATGAIGAVAGPLTPAESAQPSGPDATAAQTGCVLKSLSLRSIHVDTNTPPSAGPGPSSVRAGTSRIARIMIFKVRISCTPSTAWKVTMQIRRRRTGPDKTVAYKQFTGSGSKTFIVGADCTGGQAFNGNFVINFLGAGQSSSRVIKNKKCD